jgi:hypothetical protein
MDDPSTRATLPLWTQKTTQRCMTKSRIRENRRLDVGSCTISSILYSRPRWSFSPPLFSPLLILPGQILIFSIKIKASKGKLYVFCIFRSEENLLFVNDSRHEIQHFDS